MGLLEFQASQLFFASEMDVELSTFFVKFHQVVTVDASQGSEAPHIILSTVRSISFKVEQSFFFSCFEIDFTQPQRKCLGSNSGPLPSLSCSANFRSNRNASIGFASNPRRLCVGLSRAQKTLTIVGNATVFEPLGQNCGSLLVALGSFFRNGLVE